MPASRAKTSRRSIYQRPRVIWIASLKAKHGQGNAARAWLQRSMKRTTAAPGCQSMQILEDTENPDTILSVEVWDSRESHQQYMLSLFEPDVRPAVKEEMAVLAGPPKGKYYNPI